MITRQNSRNSLKLENIHKKTYEEEKFDIAALPSIIFKGKINFSNNFHDCAKICDNIIEEIEKLEDNIVPIGFDLEWPFDYRTGSKKTALAQICLNESVCHLLHLYNLSKLPAAFVQLLIHPKVKLVGVNVKNDVWKLGRDFSEFPAARAVKENCIECGPFANKILNRSCRWSLENLTAYMLKKKIDKNPEVRKSRWHIQPLNEAQKIYAATDAYVSLLNYLAIKDRSYEKEESCEKEESYEKKEPCEK
ncbi:PREDICTED: Werner Syndrome-like exonuclease isoform X2 [Polistes canadensis]|uniref:Werner Syndrome-like exonuclease isoform X2 n=1 Tax=Polistes canadensis TaxID=91411 RepID=UPI000718B1D9|nr:PREDICTED: Werner Syndrome-like exonuclease isoform X2 [Polistes canadensis]